ncbi:MAG TPA: ATP-binding cassette domain-containing protein [Lacipirellulaceae bacterium]|nr:ATP-binding cassette domain-containing protein [Lacipirellulaceae bacterium]
MTTEIVIDRDLITCERVGYRQKAVDILADVDWRIEQAQHWAVLGPNGSGKTTLLRIVCGYLWPTSGRVLRLGRELLDLSELRRSIGWISSAMIAEIPPGDTGLETVVSGRLAQIGLKRFPSCGPTDADFADAAEVLVSLDCESLADKPFGVLSQGERQQVLIARARMARPMLLVLDEPCAGMDPGVRERFLGWLDERIKNDEARMTNDEGGDALSDIRHSSFDICHSMPTTILVTHHVEEIVPGIRNTLVLSGGRVHAAGRTPAVLTRETIETVYGTKLARIEVSGGRLWPIWE